MKWYLLIAGYYYYPESETRDWKGTFETAEEAAAIIEEEDNYGIPKYKINEDYYDWYKIVDLRDWVGA